MPRINGSGSTSILIHASSSTATSATATSASSSTTLDGRLHRSGSSLIVGAGNHHHHHNQQQRSNNTSIVSDCTPPIRKVPLKQSSFSSSPLSARFLQNDSAPILPDRMPDSSNNSNSSSANNNNNSLAAAAKRRLSHFRASEKGKGDVLPMHISPSPLRSRTQSQGSFAISTQIFSSSASSSSGGAPGSAGSAGSGGVSPAEPQRSLRSRRKTSLGKQQLQQQHQSHSQFDEINASEHNNTYETRNSSWSDESDSGSIHNHNAQHNAHHHQQQQMYHSQHSQQQQQQQQHSHNHNNHTYPHPLTSSVLASSSTSCLQQSQHHASQKHYPLQRDASHVMGGGMLCGIRGGGGGGADNKRYYNSKSHHHRHYLQQPPLWLNMTPVQFITVMLLLAITCFVAGSYHKVLSTTEVLKEVKHEESLLLLHLQRVEQASLQLHENLSRLNDRSSSSSTNNNKQENANTAAGNSVQVDSDLIRIQTEKLREMEAELDHEVRALQKKIQTSARRSIVENYGEGAVQVYLDLYNPEGDDEGEEEEQEDSFDSTSADAGGMNAKNRIAIRLWYDTPHSAWTFLSQVSSGQWDGAVIDWNVAATGGRSIAARSTNAGLGEHQGKPGATLEPELHFVEQSERGHERYTIGLQSEGTGMFINLQDNRDFYKSEPCVGTIINGFDVLHRVIRAAQKRSAAAANSNSNIANPVRIKRALVSHLTTRGAEK